MMIDSFRELLGKGKVQCKACLFWVRIGDSSSGECRYYAPRPIVREKVPKKFDITDFENNLDFPPYELLEKEAEEQWEYCLTAWPKTNHSEYCASWEPNAECALEIAGLNETVLD